MTQSMNYVGSISILDRGDAPAQAILDRNARSLAKRVADETKEELGKVMKRVETVSDKCMKCYHLWGLTICDKEFISPDIPQKYPQVHAQLYGILNI